MNVETQILGGQQHMCLHLLNMLYSVVTSVFLLKQAVSSNIHSEKITQFFSGLLETPHSCHGIGVPWTIQTNTLEPSLYRNRRAL